MARERLLVDRRGNGVGRFHSSESRSRALRVIIALTLAVGYLGTGAGSTPGLAQDANPLVLPESYPAAISVNDSQFTFDRPSLLTTDALEPAGSDGDLSLFTRGRSDVAYAVVSDGPVVRYVPSNTEAPANPCLAEQPGRAGLAASGLTYAYAGPEPDLGPGDLDPVPGASLTIDGSSAPLFVLPDSGEAPTEYWANAGQDLERFVLTNDVGLPPQLTGAVTVGNLNLTDPVDVSGSVAIESLDRFGCAGPFPTFVERDDATVAFVLVGEQVFSFTATTTDVVSTPVEDVTGTVAADATVAEEATATEAVTEEPIATEAVPADVTTEPATPDVPTPTVGADASDTGAVSPTVLPVNYPGNLILDGGQYLFDRIVPLDATTLTERDALDVGQVYGPSDGATDRVYLQQEGGPLVRYLALSGFDGADTCLSESSSFQPLTVGDASYAFAGIEPDLTAADLVEIDGSFDIDGQSSQVYVDEGGLDPFAEIFADTPSGLYRFTLLGADGVPLMLSPSFAIDDQTATFDTDVTDSTDLASLIRVGCAGSFPVYGTAAAGPFSELFVAVGQTVLRFNVTGGVPAEPATPEPTATPTTAPTATTEPTATATAEPTATATVEPTATATVEPTATATAEPTATATAEPTATATATVAPTATATVVPTATLTPEPTATTAPAATATVAPTATQPEATVAAVDPTPTTGPIVAPPATATTPPMPTTSPSEAPTTTSASTTAATVAATDAAPVPTATRVLQPPAVVPTIPAGITVAAATVAPTTCTGPIGQYAADGYPELLPRQIQLSGVAYRLTTFANPDDSGTLTRVGCVGGFTVVSSDQQDATATLFLQVPPASVQAGQQTLFQYNVTLTFTVQAESPRQPALISNGAQSFTASATWFRSTYSSVTVELYVPVLEDLTPDLIYALRVDGGAIGSYSAATSDNQLTDEELAATGAPAGLNADLTVSGQRYILTAIWTPAGATTNGFVTLYADEANPDGTRLLGIDPRVEGLLIYERPS